MPTVDSAAIERIEYDELSQRLLITFAGGKTYKYYDVPRSVYENFLRAESKGGFFNRCVRDRYDFAQAGPA